MVDRRNNPLQDKMDLEFAKRIIKPTNGSLRYFRTCIAGLSKTDLRFLEEELKVWIREDFRKNGPRQAQHYGLPYVDAFQEIPEDVTEISDYLLRECGMNLDNLSNSGLDMCRQIFMMIKRGIQERKKDYDLKFHHFICNDYARFQHCPYQLYEK